MRDKRWVYIKLLIKGVFFLGAYRAAYDALVVLDHVISAVYLLLPTGMQSGGSMTTGNR
jgi:hypothetical protein